MHPAANPSIQHPLGPSSIQNRRIGASATPNEHRDSISPFGIVDGVGGCLADGLEVDECFPVSVPLEHPRGTWRPSRTCSATSFWAASVFYAGMNITVFPDLC